MNYCKTIHLNWLLLFIALLNSAFKMFRFSLAEIKENICNNLF